MAVICSFDYDLPFFVAQRRFPNDFNQNSHLAPLRMISRVLTTPLGCCGRQRARGSGGVAARDRKGRCQCEGQIWSDPALPRGRGRARGTCEVVAARQRNVVPDRYSHRYSRNHLHKHSSPNPQPSILLANMHSFSQLSHLIRLRIHFLLGFGRLVMPRDQVEVSSHGHKFDTRNAHCGIEKTVHTRIWEAGRGVGYCSGSSRGEGERCG